MDTTRSRRAAPSHAVERALIRVAAKLANIANSLQALDAADAPPKAIETMLLEVSKISIRVAFIASAVTK